MQIQNAGAGIEGEPLRIAVTVTPDTVAQLTLKWV